MPDSKALPDARRVKPDWAVPTSDHVLCCDVA